jgi:hypothetical protein
MVSTGDIGIGGVDGCEVHFGGFAGKSSPETISEQPEKRGPSSTREE